MSSDLTCLADKLLDPVDEGGTNRTSDIKHVQEEIVRRGWANKLHFNATTAMVTTMSWLLHMRQRPDSNAGIRIGDDSKELTDRYEFEIAPGRPAFGNPTDSFFEPPPSDKPEERPLLWSGFEVAKDVQRFLGQASVFPHEMEIRDLQTGAMIHFWSPTFPSRKHDGDYVYYIFTTDEKYVVALEELVRCLKYVFLHSEATPGCRTINNITGKDLKLRTRHRWEDLVLTEDQVRRVRQDLEFWIRSEREYYIRRLPYRRGYLFEGPPGNGKTATVRTIVSEYPFTAYMFNFHARGSSDEAMEAMFSAAADNAPALIVLEDLDRVYAPGTQLRVSKECLLNCLDGVVIHEGVVVIATANHPEFLDPAIRNRPGRFDMPVRFPNPEQSQRVKYLEFLLDASGTCNVTKQEIERVARHCKGRSMSFIKMVYESSAVRALHRGNERISYDDLKNGCENALSYFKGVETASDRAAGFKASDRDELIELRKRSRDPMPVTDGSGKAIDEKKIEEIETMKASPLAPNLSELLVHEYKTGLVEVYSSTGSDSDDE